MSTRKHGINVQYLYDREKGNKKEQKGPMETTERHFPENLISKITVKSDSTILVVWKFLIQKGLAFCWIILILFSHISILGQKWWIIENYNMDGKISHISD